MDLGAMPDVAGARVIVVRDATEAIVGCAARVGAATRTGATVVIAAGAGPP
jgi:hypothetical protein